MQQALTAFPFNQSACFLQKVVWEERPSLAKSRPFVNDDRDRDALRMAALVYVIIAAM